MRTNRIRTPELMDDPGLAREAHQHALKGLQRINAISGTSRRLWRILSRLPPYDVGPMRVLDVGCGGGDILCDLAVFAHAAGRAFEGIGIDISENACQIATSVARRRLPYESVRADFRTVDCLRDELPGEVDVVYCSLFLHHLDETEAVKLLRKMRRVARRLVIVDDLLRSRVGYALAWAGTRVLSRSHIVHTDGPLSVRAAFTEREVRQLARSADMATATLDIHWPCRFLLQWSPA